MRHFIFLLWLVLLGFPVKSQPAKRAATHRSKPIATIEEAGYRDIAIAGDSIWAVSTDGSLKLFSVNKKGAEMPLTLASNTGIREIAYLGQDTLIVSTAQSIKLLHTKTLVWKKLASLPVNTRFLARTSRRQLYASTEKGLLNLTTGQAFTPDSTLNHYYKWMPAPAAHFLDRNEILWVGFGMGEWGGNLHAFDTRAQRFQRLDFRDSLACLNPVKAFCQVNNQVYMASSVMHFMISGCITRFENCAAHRVFNSSYKSNYRFAGYDGTPSGEYIGPIAFSEAENTLYYYSQSGVFASTLNADLSKADTWRLLFAPRLRWRSGQSDAIGSSMNVRKMLLTSNGSLVLLTAQDGIGLWDGYVFYLVP